MAMASIPDFSDLLAGYEEEIADMSYLEQVAPRNTESHSVAYMSDEDPLDVSDSLASAISPLAVCSQVDGYPGVLGYTCCDSDSLSCNINGNVGGYAMRTRESAQIESILQDDENVGVSESTIFDSDTLNRNANWNVVGDVMQAKQAAQSELSSQLENLEARGYTDCDVYSSSSGIIRNIVDVDTMQAQQYDLSEPHPQYIVDSSRANDTPMLQYECNLCMESFTSECVLFWHKKIFHRGPPYECETCKKKYPTKIGLERHLRVHSDERPFRCNRCPKSFRWSSNLSAHLQTHTDELPYKCEMCPKSYRRKENLSKHLKRYPEHQNGGK